jgi:membrane associated rhomboid family serine protease
MVAHNPLMSRLPRFHRGALGVFLVTVALTLLLADQPLGDALVLHPGAVLRGERPWQPLTANFIYPEGRAGLVLGTLLVQWLVGGQLEAFWGTRKYLVLVVVSGVAGYLASVLLALGVPLAADTIVGGATPMDLAAIVAFGALMGARTLSLGGVLPLRARTLAIVVAVLAVVSPLARGAPWPLVVPGVVAMLVALLVVTQPWRRLRKSGKVGGPKRNKPRGAAHLRVIRPDDDLLN